MNKNEQNDELSLNKECLRTLSDAQMEEVNGGFSPILTLTPEISAITIVLADD